MISYGLLEMQAAMRTRWDSPVSARTMAILRPVAWFAISSQTAISKAGAAEQESASALQAGLGLRAIFLSPQQHRRLRLQIRLQRCVLKSFLGSSASGVKRIHTPQGARSRAVQSQRVMRTDVVKAVQVYVRVTAGSVGQTA